MAITHNSNFDRARRTLYVAYQEMPRRIGAVEIGEAKGRGKLQILLPYSMVITPDDTVYYESNPFVAKPMSTDDLADIYFIRPSWAEIEDVVSVNGAPLTIRAGDNPSGLTELTGTMDIHKFGWV